MLITTQYTRSYFDKANALYLSGQEHDVNIIINEIIIKDTKSYRTIWPTNRPFFVTQQSGEFLCDKTFDDVDDDEIIICVDADSIMNRPFTEHEIIVITEMIKKFDFLSVYGAYPATPLKDVLVNLNYNPDKLQPFLTTEKQWENHGEFTNSFVIAKKKTFARLKKLYLHYFDDMTELTGHHAGVQWLANWIIYTKMSVGILTKQYQCGSWYDGCTEEDANNAVFNHTK